VQVAHHQGDDILLRRKIEQVAAGSQEVRITGKRLQQPVNIFP
jgi:hypothetical protein